MSASPQTLSAPPRRPLKTRQRAWAQALARMLTRAGASPNAISVASLVFAVGAGVCLAYTAYSGNAVRIALFLTAAACIQLRLLCNMLDGMVAVEGGKRTVYGEIFNDMPDRFADVAILVGAGYSITPYPWGRELGWLAATLAVLTAYVRLLGGSMGVTQYFIGPMAKPHRMALLTAACVVASVEARLGICGRAIALALLIMVAGMLITCVRRTARIAADLKRR